MPNCFKCGERFSNRITVDGVIRVLSSRKYCLICSPFNEHNTLKLHERGKLDVQPIPSEKRCPKCSHTKAIAEFYVLRNKQRVHGWCKECINNEATERGRRLKRQALDYLGASCRVCGYDRYVGALEFHHVDPSIKRFGISQIRCRTLSAEIRDELDKCIVLCATCHREVEGGVRPCPPVEKARRPDISQSDEFIKA